jgi:glutamate dehydrogenase
LCFEKYVDAIIDLLIPGSTPGIKEEIVDLYKKPELLFFGPDGEIMEYMYSHISNTCRRGYCGYDGLGC